MFLRLLYESFRRQRRRKLLAGVAILLGTTAVTAMLALATTIGDRIHQELAVYGANIVVTPQADLLDVKVGGVNLKPATGGAYLRESDLIKLRGIFWANNITGVSPELPLHIHGRVRSTGAVVDADGKGLWFNHIFGTDRSALITGASALHPVWKIQGVWPNADFFSPATGQVLVGRRLADRLGLKIGDTIVVPSKASWNGEWELIVSGTLSAGDDTDEELLVSLKTAQKLSGLENAVSRVEISARTKPEDAFARQDPDKLTGKKHDLWYCSPYANSIAYQIREAIPGANAQQVRQVEQSEGTVLSRISGLMWLISAAALLAAGFAVSAAMATAILERRAEIGLMRSLGASRSAIALLFYSETGLLAVFAGACGYLIGSSLAAWLGAKIFATGTTTTLASIHLATVLNPVLLPIVVGLALIVAIAGSTPAIRTALRMDPSAILRADA